MTSATSIADHPPTHPTAHGAPATSVRQFRDRRSPAGAAAKVALAAAVLTTGCVSRVTGNEGNLVFSYAADDNLLDFNKPIAVGGRIDLAVTEVGNNKTVSLQTATSDAPKVLEVKASEGSSITLEGVADGNAEISVTARTASAETVSDSVNMTVRAAEVLKLRHACTSATTAHYLVGNLALLPFELERSNGQAVIGYGYYPVSISPDKAMTLETTHKSQQYLWLQMGSSAATITLASTIDSATLTLELVEAGAIDGALLDGDALATTAIAGTKKLVHVRPTVGSSPVCGANTEISAVSTAPEVCKVKALSVANEASGVVDAWGWVEVDALAVGKCTFDVSYPKAKAGAGVTVGQTLDVVEIKTP